MALEIFPSDKTHFRHAMRQFAGAVNIVTTSGSAGRRGLTVSAATSVSDNPPTVLVCLNLSHADNDWFVENGNFCINTLAASQLDLARAFAGEGSLDQAQRFAKGEWHNISTGAPALNGAAASFDCTLIEAKDVATHRILIGAVKAISFDDDSVPLLYHRQTYCGIGETF